VSERTKRVRVPDLKEMKKRGERIAMLTAYDATMARWLDRAGVDLLLVGDSLGMVMLGHETTIPVTLDVMVHHTAAVARATQHALVVADMPFLSYQIDAAQAMSNAGRLIQQGGAAAVKLEGGGAVAEITARLVGAGIPVMGHLGLVPQSVHQFGGFRQQAKTREQAETLLADARVLEQAGAFAVVLECIPAEVARTVSAALTIPTIGIGAGPYCDGQVLVVHDAMGLTESAPSFAKQFAQLGAQLDAGARAYIDEVKRGVFPPAPVKRPTA
jgi:3-methyl-2-oxobutanoate hydroxymethyltransferase